MLREANFKADKSLTAWEKLQKQVGLLKTLKNVVVFLANTLEEDRGLSLLKVPQWYDFKRLMDAATQMLVCCTIGVEVLVLGLEECENSQTSTTTTTGSKTLQKEVNNQIDNQDQCSVPPKVPSLQGLDLV